jgi:hypothetical protein
VLHGVDLHIDTCQSKPASDGAASGRVGCCSGLKKQKDRPKAAANDDDDPFLPHLFFQCRIVHEVSADFFRTPPLGGWVSLTP